MGKDPIHASGGFMEYVVRAYPLNTGISPKDVREFAEKLRARGAETTNFYESFGVKHESWYVQETPSGPWVICVAVIDNPQAAGEAFARSKKPFDVWWKSEVLRLSGVNPEQTPLGPPTVKIFHWDKPAS
jgi:hypothetical protein